MRNREPYRSVNAARATDEHAARELGYKSQHDLEKDRERQGKYTDDAARRAIILPSRVLSFYIEATAVSTVMRRAPKTTTVMSTAVRYPMGAAGRVIGASIWTTAAWSAGSAQLRLRISKGGGTETSYLLPLPCIIDGLTGDDGHIRSQSAEWLCPVKNGIRFATGEAIRLELALSGWSGANDWGAELIVVYDGLS